MKVIIKPMGLVILVCALIALTFVAFRGRIMPPAPVSTPPIADATPAPEPGATTNAPLSGGVVIEGGFEEKYTPVGTGAKDNKAQLSGTIAGNGAWFDNSSWSKVTAEYAPDETNPHSGKRSQRISIAPGEGQIQFAQVRPLSISKDYDVSVWVRASRRVRVILALRIDDTTKLKSSEAFADETWRKITFRVFRKPTKGESNLAWIILYLRDPGVTYWIDDAAIEPVNSAGGETPR